VKLKKNNIKKKHPKLIEDEIDLIVFYFKNQFSSKQQKKICIFLKVYKKKEDFLHKAKKYIYI